MYNDDDDFSSFMDVYTTSSSSPTSAAAAGATVGSSGGAGIESGLVGSQSPDISGSQSPGWATINNQFGGSAASSGPQSQWSSGGSFNSQQPGGVANAFDQITNSLDKSRDRALLAPNSRQSTGGSSAPLATRRSSNGSVGAGTNGQVNVPTVPSSTTTAAPEYVMINPSRTSDDSSDQDE